MLTLTVKLGEELIPVRIVPRVELPSEVVMRLLSGVPAEIVNYYVTSLGELPIVLVELPRGYRSSRYYIPYLTMPELASAVESLGMVPSLEDLAEIIKKIGGNNIFFFNLASKVPENLELLCELVPELANQLINIEELPLLAQLRSRLPSNVILEINMEDSFFRYYPLREIPYLVLTENERPISTVPLLNRNVEYAPIYPVRGSGFLIYELVPRPILSLPIEMLAKMSEGELLKQLRNAVVNYYISYLNEQYSKHVPTIENIVNTFTQFYPTNASLNIVLPSIDLELLNPLERGQIRLILRRLIEGSPTESTLIYKLPRFILYLPLIRKGESPALLYQAFMNLLRELAGKELAKVETFARSLIPNLELRYMLSIPEGAQSPPLLATVENVQGIPTLVYYIQEGGLNPPIFMLAQLGKIIKKLYGKTPETYIEEGVIKLPPLEIGELPQPIRLIALTEEELFNPNNIEIVKQRLSQ